MTQVVICPGECFLFSWENSGFCCLGMECLKISIRAIWYNVCFKACITKFLCRWSVIWCKWGVKVPNYYCLTLDFPFYGSSHLPFVLRCSYIACINIYSCCIFLDWSLQGGCLTSGPSGKSLQCIFLPMSYFSSKMESLSAFFFANYWIGSYWKNSNSV